MDVLASDEIRPVHGHVTAPRQNISCNSTSAYVTTIVLLNIVRVVSKISHMLGLYLN